ncbi:MAG: AAA family ATPase [Candidatus Micrarchaeota archaeon]|nr:AAA family ATPase [Candidatus Micrarchaeota archaeon]
MEMNEAIFSELFAISERAKERAKKREKKRSMYFELEAQLPKSKAMHCIAGLRGVGKTVVMLQLANLFENSIYTSSEELLLRSVSFYDFINYCKKKGFVNIFLDEVHLYSNWPLELKAAFDEEGAKITFSGSSALALREGSADLSRRVVFHFLPPLSFREYLLLKYNVVLPKVSVEDLVDFDKRKALITAIAPYANRVDDYLAYGALPFSLEEENSQPLYEGILSKIVRLDLAHLKKIDVNHVESVYKLLGFIATSSPDKISYNSIANALNKNMYVVMEIIRLLNEIGLLMCILSKGGSGKTTRKEYKLLLLPPFRSVISRLRSAEVQKGALREEFFVNHVGAGNVKYIKTDRKRRTPDYVYKNWVFEVGGMTKDKKGGDYVVADGLPIDVEKIPLALFGLLY